MDSELDSELFYVGIEPKGHHAKPAGKDMKYVKYNTVNNYGMCDLKTIVELVGNEGHAILPAYLKDGMKRENFQGMQIFMLDFDGQKISPNTGEKNGTNISYEEVKERAKQYGLEVAFAYKTFSCPDTKEFYKFRIALIHNMRIEDPNLAQFTYNMLKKIFCEADGSCAELARIFLGGKEVIDFNPNATHFDLVQLKKNIQPLLDNNNHYAREQKRLLRNTEISYDKTIVVDYVENMSIYGLNRTATNINILEKAPFKPLFYKKGRVVQDDNDLHQKPVRDEKKPKKRYHIDVHKKKRVCFLMDAFLDGTVEELSHAELFHLATNLSSIRNGRKIFFEALSTSASCQTEDIDKWIKDWCRDIRNYSPETCTNNQRCRFYSECCKNNPCHNIVDKYLKDKGIDVGKIELCTLDEELDMLNRNIESFMNSTQNGIHIVRGSTGIGKTQAILQLLERYPQHRFLIVEPLCDLRNQVYERLIKYTNIPNEDVINILSATDVLKPEEYKEFTALHDGGNHAAAIDLLSKKLKKLKKTKINNTEKELEIIALENVLYGDKLFQEKRIAFTTHAKLARMPRDSLKNCIIIIDEDILLLQFLNNSHTISKEVLQMVADSGIPGYSIIAKEMLKAEEGYFYRANFTNYNLPEWSELTTRKKVTDDMDDDYDFYDNNDIIASSVNNNITDLREMGAYVRDGDTFQYFCINKLYTDLKYLVLSATFDAKIYRDFFGKKMNIIEYPSCVAQYQGKLKQYTYYSMSRRTLGEHREIYDYIKDNFGDIDIISFKSENKADNAGDMHFGNSVGRNDLEGKDIVIIGTPFKKPDAYKLVYLWTEFGKWTGTKTKKSNL